MLERAAGLSSRSLQAIAELEERVVDADGGRLKLEWGHLRGRTGERVEDLLWWDGDRLLGFLGLYEIGSSIELAGMVAPEARGRGIATALLNAALPLCRDRAEREVLLIVPRGSVAGKRLALRRGAALDHSEHALVLAQPPSGGSRHPSLSLRRARPTDTPGLARLFELGFGDPAPDVADRLESPREQTLVVELGGSTVGTLRLSPDGNDVGIYAFTIDPSWQGRGIGREALWRVCEQMRAEGAHHIRLEVAVENDRALRLYTSIGFTPVATEDYYALPRQRART